MNSNRNRLTDSQLERLDNVLNELSENQMNWVSGYLAGKLANTSEAGAKVVSSSSAEPVESIANLTVLYATETGNSQVLADKMAEKARFKHINAEVFNLYEYDVNKLSGEENVALIISTHGEGDIPEMADGFYKHITAGDAPSLKNTSFSVLALGDKTYKHFCTGGEKIYEAFKNLGAFNIVPISRCDVDYELDAEIWMNTFLTNVRPSTTELTDELVADDEEKEYSKTNPFDAKVLKKEKLSGESSDKEVYHVELSIEGSGLIYEPGDAVGIYTKNPEALVDKIIQTTGFDSEQRILIKEGEVSVKQALTNHFELTVLTYHLLSEYAEKTNIAELKELLKNDTLLDEYIDGRDLLDLLEDYPFEWNVNKLVEVLRPMPARLYSISSSQAVVENQVHATISLVRFEKDERLRLGACSSHIAYSIEEGALVSIYIDKNPLFKLPEDNSAVIMIGAGTGIAPYRAFMQQRKNQGYNGYSWLFYGDRRSDADFLYKTEWEELIEDESLERMDVAFSRDQKQKIYVQDKLMENKEEVFEWIENGAYLYLCGDKKNMAKDVNKALLDIIQAQADVDEEQAEQYIRVLKQEKRFQLDVY